RERYCTRSNDASDGKRACGSRRKCCPASLLLDSVTDVKDSVVEAALVEEFELHAHVSRQPGLAATDDDRTDEQVALVHESGAERVSREGCTANREFGFRRGFHRANSLRVEVAFDARALRRNRIQRCRV